MPPHVFPVRCTPLSETQVQILLHPALYPKNELTKKWVRLWVRLPDI